MKIIDRSRRRFTGALGAGAASSWLGACAGAGPAGPDKKLGRVLVVGGGFGGATAARYIKRWAGASIEVMLVERNPEFVSCPISNLVLAGTRKIEDLTIGYGGLRQQGVIVVNDEVTAIEAKTKRAFFSKIADQSFDRIVVSPGVDFMFDEVQGLDAEAQKTILHAWKAGAQTVALRRQLEAMADGGVFVMTIPKAPYRCPPGPYERACQVASYFKAAKPRSKVILLDANPEITSKKGLFARVFAEQYKGLIEYQPNMVITEVEAKTLTAVSEVGDRVKADVLNVLPPQRAGDIARQAGLINANRRWCQIDWVTMESTAAPGIHVLGDATLAAPAMPKSGHFANQHGKAAAAAIVESMNGRAPQPPVMTSTCYSYVDDKNVIHVSSVHQYSPDTRTLEPVAGAGGLSAESNLIEGVYAEAWARNIWKDTLGA